MIAIKKLSISLLLWLNAAFFFGDLSLAEGNMPSIMLSGTLNDRESVSSLVQHLDVSAEKLLMAGEYNINAQLSFKTKNLPVLVDDSPLLFEETECSYEGFKFFRTFGVNNVDKLVTAEAKSHDEKYLSDKVILGDYDELWVNYRDSLSNSNEKIKLQISTQKNVSGEEEIVFIGGDDIIYPSNAVGQGTVIEQDEFGFITEGEAPEYASRDTLRLTEIKRDKIGKGEYLRKQYSYLVKRTLGFDGLYDSDWRFAPEKGRVVLQRRFTEELTDIEAIDVILSPGTKLEAVNLRVASKGQLADVVIHAWNILGPVNADVGWRVRRLSNVRLSIRELLQFHLPNAESPVLKEMIFFIRGDSEQIVKSQPIRELRWMELFNRKKSLQAIAFEWPQSLILDVPAIAPPKSRPEFSKPGRGLNKKLLNKWVLNRNRPPLCDGEVAISEDIEAVSILVRKENLGGHKRRLRVNLVGLAHMMVSGSYLKEISLKIYDDKLSQNDAIDVESFRLVRLRQVKRPVISELGNQKLSEWRGGSSGLIRKDGFFPWPTIDQYHSLKFLGEVKPSLRGTKLIDSENQEILHLSPDGKTLFSNLVSEDSVSSFANGLEFNDRSGGLILQVVPDGLNLSNIDKWVDLIWSMDTALPNRVRAHLGITEGIEGIETVRVSAMAGEVVKGTWYIPPGGATELEAEEFSPLEIDQLVLRVLLKPGSSELTLKELVLFRPEMVSSLKEFTPLPHWKSHQLIPVWYKNLDGLMITTSDGGLMVSLEDKIREPLTWSTPINENSSDVQTIQMEYHVGQKFFRQSNKCWLRMTVLGNLGGLLEKEICPQFASGNMVIPLGSIVDPHFTGFDQVVEHIKWEVLWPKGASTFVFHEPMRFSMKLNTAIRSMNAMINAEPLFQWSGINYYPDITGLQRLNEKVRLGSFVLNKNEFLSLEEIQFFNHPYLDLRSISLERTQPYTLHEWHTMAVNGKSGENAESEMINKPIKLILFLSAGLVLCWVAWKGWLRQLSAKTMSLLLWVWQILLTVSLIKRIVELVSGRWVGLLFWTGISISFYGVILFIPAGRDVSYLITFGGISAVLAWGALVWHIRPGIELRWPVLAHKVYGGVGTHYFSGFILFLIGGAFMLVFDQMNVAEQLAIIGFYMLAAGVALEGQAVFLERVPVRERRLTHI